MSKKLLKDQLRCENCNRLTYVDSEMWDKLKEDPCMVFLCERAICSKITIYETFSNVGKTLKIYTKFSHIKEPKNVYLD
jgi:hypothetical protein